MKEHEIEVLNPFGPKIFKIQLSSDIIGKLIDITDKLIIDKNREKSNGCNLAGQIEEEVKIHSQILKDNKLYDLFNMYLKEYIKHCLDVSDESNNKVISEVSSMWFNETGKLNPASSSQNTAGAAGNDETNALENTLVSLTVANASIPAVMKDLIKVINRAPHGDGLLLFDEVNSVYPGDLTATLVTAIAIKRTTTSIIVAAA